MALCEDACGSAHMFTKRNEHDLNEIAAMTRDLSKQMAEVLSRLDQIAQTQRDFAVGTNPVQSATVDPAIGAADEAEGADTRRKAKRDRKKAGRHQ